MSEKENVEEVKPTTAATDEQTSPASKEHNEENCAEGVDEVENSVPSPEEQITMLNDKYLRLSAEFDNFRKRNARERVELIQTASKDVIKDLLDVLDDCARTEQLLSNKDVEIKALKEGVQLVFNKLRKTLEQKGLQAFDSKEKEFDVELHEAITEIPAPHKKLKGKVVDEIQKGYNLNGKLIRHARVVIGK